MIEKSSAQQLRRFALIVSTGLCVVGLLSWARDHTFVSVIVWTIAAVLLLFGLIAPTCLQPFERAWMGLAMLLAWVNTRIILALVFYLVIIPIGSIMRLFHDPLDRQLRGGRSSYWIPKQSKPLDPKAYENQF